MPKEASANGLPPVMRNEIKQAILELPHKNGDTLPSVRKLMDTFSASSGTIQTILKRMVQENLVYSIPGKGYFWGTAPSASDFANLLSQKAARETVMDRLEKAFANDWEKGVLNPSKPLPLSKELAERYNVSQTNLRKFLTQKVNAGILQHRGRQYRFTPPQKERDALNFSEIIFVTRCNSMGGFTAESERELDFLRFVYQTAGELGYKLILLGINEESGKLIDRSGEVRTLANYPNAIGAVLSTLLVQKPQALLQIFFNVEFPVSVWWEHPLTEIPKRYLQKLNWAFFNSTFGDIPGKQLGSHLMQKGFRRVCYFSPYHNSSWSKDRLAGLKSSGLEVREFVDDEYASPWDFKEIARNRVSMQSIEIYARNLVKEKLAKFSESVNPETDCWVCVNDEVAGIYCEMNDEGTCKIPGPKTNPRIYAFDNSAESYLLRIASYDFNTSALVKQIFYYIGNPDGFSNKRKIHQILGQVIEK